MVKLFIATFGTESNTFATYPASKADFEDGLWCETGIVNAVVSPWSGPARLWHDRAVEMGWELCESIHAFAQPGGTLLRSAYEELRDRILKDVQDQGPFDAVLLSLHGAMVAQGYDDCEGDLVERVRAIVGPDVKIGVELDLHAHLDDRIVDAADLIVMFKTYPHIDHNDRAEDLFDLMVRLIAGEIDPKMALFDCRTLALYPTTRAGPMPGFMADMIAAEGHDGILSLSLNHGFPWADVPMGGAKMLAVHDGSQNRAADVAQEFGQRFYQIRQEAALTFTPMDEAIDRALGTAGKPVLLADVSDQTGGGAPGDTTYMPAAFLQAGISAGVFGPIWDPASIALCFQLGVGAKARLRIGGKSEPQSGPPLDADVEILFLGRDCAQETEGPENVPIGDVATVRSHGVDIVLTSSRTNVYTPSFFTRHGVDLTGKQVIGIKNLYKHTDVFAPLVSEQFYVATPGICQPDLTKLDFRRLNRPIWPFDADPLGQSGP